MDHHDGHNKHHKLAENDIKLWLHMYQHLILNYPWSDTDEILIVKKKKKRVLEYLSSVTQALQHTDIWLSV